MIEWFILADMFGVQWLILWIISSAIITAIIWDVVYAAKPKN